MILLEQRVTPPDPPKLIYSLAFETLILGSLVIAGGIWLGALGNGMGILSVCGASVLILLKIRSTYPPESSQRLRLAPDRSSGQSRSDCADGR